ncbi:TetR/AcrR family transcriptional regulator [Humibacter albus]|uniref:TetR/AcrR family transcriptional regulator n=1 Tax=Humibacter albus TaxID=427754 RepID=UPI0003B5C2DA|nr:TetR/AcrR family transcriptional regulator C-terminal ligand-binding domain-containing protein [Humibacter albus]
METPSIERGLQSVGTSRPGGRTARTRAAVHAAVRELLAESGGATPSIPEVAARSGVHAATIYRRWRTPEGLLLDVVVDDVNDSSPVPVTGDLRVDLTAYATNLITAVRRPGGLGFFRAIIAAARAPGGSAVEIETVVRPRLAAFQAMLDASGTKELTPYDLIDLVIAPVYVSATFGVPSADASAEAGILVDNTLAVLQHRRARG